MFPSYHVYISTPQAISWEYVTKCSNRTVEISGMCELYGVVNNNASGDITSSSPSASFNADRNLAIQQQQQQRRHEEYNMMTGDSDNNNNNNSWQNSEMMLDKIVTLLDTTELFFIAIPPQFSIMDLLQFARVVTTTTTTRTQMASQKNNNNNDNDNNIAIPSHVLGCIRIIHPFTNQHSLLIKFANVKHTRDCYYQCHGQRFIPPLTDICHAVIATQIEFHSTPKNQNWEEMGYGYLNFNTFSIKKHTSPQQQQQQQQQQQHHNNNNKYKNDPSNHENKSANDELVQLPLCPNCLERLDPSITHLWSHLCRPHVLLEHTQYNNDGHKNDNSSNHNDNNNNNNRYDELDLPSHNNQDIHRFKDTVILRDTDSNTNDDTSVLLTGHNSIISAGICRCMHRWIHIKCPVCKVLYYIHHVLPRKEQEQKQDQDQDIDPESEQEHKRTHDSSKNSKNKKSSSNTKKESTKINDRDLQNWYRRSQQIFLKDKYSLKTCCQSENKDLWICMICANIGCGRMASQHALQHFNETKHRFTLHIYDLYVWDYIGDQFVQRVHKKAIDVKFQHHLSLIREQEKLEQNIEEMNELQKLLQRQHNTETNYTEEQDQSLDIPAELLLDQRKQREDLSSLLGTLSWHRSQPQDDTETADAEERELVMSKLENMQMFYNRIMTEAILQQSKYFEDEISNSRRDWIETLNRKKKRLSELNEQLESLDKKMKNLETYEKMVEMEQENYKIKKEIEKLLEANRQQNLEKIKLQNKFEEREIELNASKQRQIEQLRAKIDEAIQQLTK